jgi:hypothetical protein
LNVRASSEERSDDSKDNFMKELEQIFDHFPKQKSSSPVTGLEWPRGFQEVKVPRFHDNGTGWW